MAKRDSDSPVPKKDSMARPSSVGDAIKGAASRAYEKSGTPYDPSQGIAGFTKAPPLQPMSEGAADQLASSETALLSSAAGGNMGTVPESLPPAPAPSIAEPGIYGAKGDPYTYRVDPDGSVTIASGPSGEGAKLTAGTAFDAIMGQIKSGQLTPRGGSGASSLSAEEGQLPPHSRV